MRIRVPQTAVTLTLGVMLTAGLTACSGAGADTRTVVEFWDFYPTNVGNQGLQLVIDEFEKQHPDIRIKRTSMGFEQLEPELVNSVAVKKVPDAALVDTLSTQSLASLDALAPIAGAAPDEAYFPGAAESVKFEGEVVGIPMTVSPLALIYNKKMFQEAGLTPPTTWDEFRAAAGKLSTDGRYGFAMSTTDSEEGTMQFLPLLWGTGGDLSDYSSSAIKPLQLLRDLTTNDELSRDSATWTSAEVRHEFVQGRAAMMINGPWDLKGMTESVDVGVAPMPSSGGAPKTTFGGESAVVLRGAKHAEAAQQFVSFLGSPEGIKLMLQRTQQLPARVDMVDQISYDQPAQMAQFAALLPDTKARGYGYRYKSASGEVSWSVAMVLKGELAPAAAADQAGWRISALH